MAPRQRPHLPASLTRLRNRSRPQTRSHGPFRGRPLSGLPLDSSRHKCLRTGKGGSTGHLMSRAGDIASEQRQLLIEAWRAVASAAGGLQLLRVDSLAWQLAEAAGTSEWESAITKRLTEAGSPPDTARRLAAELNWAACCNPLRFLSHASIWFQLPLFWSAKTG